MIRLLKLDYLWFIRLAMECIPTVKMQILWQGELTHPFTPTRGIR